MKKISIFITVIVLLGVLGACQPTPGMEAQPSESYETEEENGYIQYKKCVALDDGIQLVISASVVEPNGEFLQGNITWQSVDASFVDNAAYAFSNNHTFYKACETWPELTSHIQTYTNQLDSVRDKLSADNIQMLEGIIANMQDALGSAPETEPAISIDEVMTEQEAKIQTGCKNKAVLVIGGGNRKKFIRISNYRWKDIMQGQPTPRPISEEDALQRAENILKKLELADDFTLSAIRYTSAEYTLVASTANQTGISDYPVDERIELIYMRNIGGQKQVFSQQIEGGTAGREYAETVFWEMIKMYFDNDGLVELVWQQPCSIVIEPDACQIISVDEALNAMSQFMSVSQNRYTYSSLNIDPKRITVRIDSVELGMSCIVGSNNAILAVPVWEFYGNIEYIDDNGDVKYIAMSNVYGNQMQDESIAYNSLCTINALTGKRIDRMLGY